MAGLASGIASGAAAAASRAQDAVNAVTDAARAAAQIQSPSRVFAEIGDYLMQGLSQGISGGTDGVKVAMGQAVNEIAQTLDEEGRRELSESWSFVADHWAAVGGDGIEAMAEAVREGGDDLTDALVDAVSDARDAAEQQMQEWRDTGSDFIGGLLDGMREGDLGGFFEGFISDARASFDSLLSSVLDGTQTFSQAIGGAFSNISQGFGMIGGGNVLGGLGSVLSGFMPILGGISTVIGLISSFSSSRLIGTGVEGVIGAGLNNLATTETKSNTSWWGLRKWTSTDYDATGMGPILKENSKLVKEGLEEQLASIGLGAGRLKGIQRKIKFSTQGMTSEEVEEQIKREYEALADDMLKKYGKDLGDFRELGERPTETLERLTTNLAVFNDVAKVLALDTLPKTVEGAVQASKALDGIGGADVFAAGYNSYVTGILDEDEQIKVAKRTFNQAAKNYGIDVTQFTDRDSFQAAVERASEKGNTKRYAELISIAPLFADLMSMTDAVEEVTVALDGLSEAAIEEGRFAYQTRILGDEQYLRVLEGALKKEQDALGVNVLGAATDEDFIAKVNKHRASGNTDKVEAVLSLADEWADIRDLEEAIKASEEATRENTQAQLVRENFSTVAGYERAVRQSEAGNAWAYDWASVGIPGGNQGAQTAVMRELTTLMKDLSENGMTSIRLLRKIAALNQEGNNVMAANL